MELNDIKDLNYVVSFSPDIETEPLTFKFELAKKGVKDKKTSYHAPIAIIRVPTSFAMNEKKCVSKIKKIFMKIKDIWEKENA